jgi:signal transduction histidine kinase
MIESWEMIRHVAEVLGMIFLPILGWMLFTLNNHSKKIILLEERVNETITTRLSNLEERMDDVNKKVDENHALINDIAMNVNSCKMVLDDRDQKLDSILEQVKKMSEK